MQGALLAAAERIEHLEREAAVLAVIAREQRLQLDKLGASYITTYALHIDPGAPYQCVTRVFVNTDDIIGVIMSFGAILESDWKAVARGEDNAVDEDAYDYSECALAVQTAAVVCHILNGIEGTKRAEDNSGGPFTSMAVTVTVLSLLAADPPVEP